MQTQKKTYLLPQKLIDEMKRTFGAKTETDALICAMKEISFRSRLLKWHQKYKGKLKIRNLYAFAILN